MNGAQELLHSGRCCVCALQVGRAPDRWRQDLQQQTTRVKALPQYCHWISSVTKVEMKLQDQPLLGSCLPSLTGETERLAIHPPVKPRSLPAPQRLFHPQPAESAEICPPPQRFARRHFPVDRPDPSEPERVERSNTERSNTDQCSAREPLHLPLKASADLLQCLVHNSNSTKPLPEATNDPKVQAASSTPEPSTQRRAVPTPLPPRTPKLPREVCLDTTNQKRWRQQLVQRTDDYLRSEPTHLNSSELPRLKQTELPSLATSLDKKNNLSNDPWLCLFGTIAPLDLLTDLAKPRSMISNRPETVDKPERSNELLPASEPHLRSNHNFDQVPTQSRPAIAPWQNSQSQSPLEMLSQLSDRAKPNATEPERIAPPTVAPTLAPLVASQTGEASPSVTTPLIQQQAIQEAIPEADLDGLASQIKRILDEEARRYGINV